MKFIKLIDANDGTDVYVNPQSVNAIYIHKDKTVVCTGKQCIPVEGKAETVAKHFGEIV